MRLVVVSNRLPVTVIRGAEGVTLGRSPGGMAAGVHDLVSGFTGETSEGGAAPSIPREWIWVGWPGGPITRPEEPGIRELLRARKNVPVFLSPEQESLFYDGFSNRVLWPLCHYFSDGVRIDPRWWEAYEQVNRLFAQVVGSVLEPDDLVWVHDYQLMLLPALLRAANPTARIGYFHHIPFPEYELLRCLPAKWRHALIDGVLGADRIGFHTYSYAEIFLRAARRDRGESATLGAITRPTHTARVGVYPMGIDTERFERGAMSPLTDTERIHLDEVFGTRTVVLSIDRLDYTKGLVDRLRGFERFLERNPEELGRISLALVVVPSRVGVPAYRAMKRAVDQLVGSINGRFSTATWNPIVYRYSNLAPAELSALYQRGDIALVSPLRDGMNLVAKEYIASRGDTPGVLILSAAAGAADELSGALIVDPADEWSIAAALEQAIRMSGAERRERFQTMLTQVKQRTVHRWGREFIEGLLETAESPPVVGLTAVAREVVSRFRAARAKLLFLDYDGTLVGFQVDPGAVAPDGELLQLLDRLSAESGTSIVIVSGRSRRTLEEGFGHLPVGFIAEHGAAIMSLDGVWSEVPEWDCGWKAEIRTVLDRFVAGVPGSFVEEKSSSLVWHYRGAFGGVAGAQRAAERARDLVEFLLAFTGQAKLRVLTAHQAVEIQRGGIDKGSAAQRFFAGRSYDYIGALGDDRTDEDLFTILPAAACTIRVGDAPSRARFRLRNYTEARLLLADCVANTTDDGVTPYLVPNSRSPASPSPGTI